jgi:hypothetical protein
MYALPFLLQQGKTRAIVIYKACGKICVIKSYSMFTYNIESLALYIKE